MQIYYLMSHNHVLKMLWGSECRFPLTKQAQHMEWQGARDSLTSQINPGYQWVTDVLARSPPQQCWPHEKHTTLYLIFSIFLFLYTWLSAWIQNQSYTLAWMWTLSPTEGPNPSQNLGLMSPPLQQWEIFLKIHNLKVKLFLCRH